ncbi:nudix hydrolase 20 [Crassisporium funariophilum]|nr:nudix hydrolase 20 [Crassisporium funariophilum]
MSSTQTAPLTYLDVVDICDNVHIHRQGSSIFDSAYNSEILIPFHLSDSAGSPAIGLLRPIIIEQLRLENERSKRLGFPETWVMRLDSPDFIVSSKRGSAGPSPRVSFRAGVDTPAARTAVMKELCKRWRDQGTFADVCGPTKWRDEMYPIYADPFGVHDYHVDGADVKRLNYAFEMERSACALFGVVTYGIHMTVYDEVVDEHGRKSLRMWVPTRALTKPTFPGYLDNTVAGGIPSGMPMFESLVKECMEEASIQPDVVRKYARAVGAISYFYRTSKGWLQPEIEYVYDIIIPPNVDPAPFTPRPLDGEVESFEFVSHGQLLTQLRAGLFKPNCGLVIIDLFIRLGYITPDNEPDFMKIINRLHGDFDYGQW